MTPTEDFKRVIEAKLQEMATADPLFAVSLRKEKKNIDGCINYILTTVQKSGCNGFTDEEIFSMAAHYYDEDDIKNEAAPKCKVVVNRTIELTPEELQDARKAAIEQAIAQERDKFTKKAAPKKPEPAQAQPTLF